MCYCPTPTLHLNLALTGEGAFLLSPPKMHTVWFISVLNYGDTENVLINHLLLVIPMSYPCHYTNLCPYKPHKHAPPPPPHTHTHTHTHAPPPTHTRTHARARTRVCFCEKWGHPIVMVFIILLLTDYPGTNNLSQRLQKYEFIWLKCDTP